MDAALSRPLKLVHRAMPWRYCYILPDPRTPDRLILQTARTSDVMPTDTANAVIAKMRRDGYR